MGWTVYNSDGKILQSAELGDNAVTTAKILDDAVTVGKLANSINTDIDANTAKTGITSGQASAISANSSKVTNATHTGDVTGATALTIATGAVDMAMLATTAGTAGSGTFLRGDGQWQAAGGLRSTQFVPVRFGSTNITLHSAVSSYGVTEQPNDSSLGNIAFTVMIPSDVTTLEKAVILVMTPDPSGDARLDFSASWGAIGESLTDTQTTISVDNYPLTRWNHTEIDISGMLSGLAAGDILGVQMNKQGTHTDDTVGRLRTWGLVLEWS